MTDHIYTTTLEIEKARGLWEKAIFLAENNEGYHTKKLYQLHNLYVEVTWHTHFNVAMKVVTFHNTALLEPYLELISLDGLLD